MHAFNEYVLRPRLPEGAFVSGDTNVLHIHIYVCIYTHIYTNTHTHKHESLSVRVRTNKFIITSLIFDELSLSIKSVLNPSIESISFYLLRNLIKWV